MSLEGWQSHVRVPHRQHFVLYVSGESTETLCGLGIPRADWTTGNYERGVNCCRNCLRELRKIEEKG